MENKINFFKKKNDGQISLIFIKILFMFRVQFFTQNPNMLKIDQP